MYVRFPLSLRNFEDLLAERGIDICHETVRYWWNRFGPMFVQGSDEGAGQCREAGGETLGQQPGGKQPLALPKARTGNAQVPADEELTKVRLGPRQRPQHFNLERHLIDRVTYKTRRSAALAEWQLLMA